MEAEARVAGFVYTANSMTSFSVQYDIRMFGNSPKHPQGNKGEGVKGLKGGSGQGLHQPVLHTGLGSLLIILNSNHETLLDVFRDSMVLAEAAQHGLVGGRGSRLPFGCGGA